MSQEENPKDKSNKALIMWILVCTFIVCSIGLMFAVDYYYAPELLNPSTLPEAVSK